MKIDRMTQEGEECLLQISGALANRRYNVIITPPMPTRGPEPEKHHYNVGSSAGGQIQLVHPIINKGIVKASFSEVLSGLTTDGKQKLGDPSNLEYMVV
jgi:hypothetical protein